MNAVLLFAVGFVAAAALWLGLRVLPRRVRTLEEVRAFGEARGAQVLGDGVSEPLRVVGGVGGRAFTVVYQAEVLRGAVLLVAVDCDVPDGAAVAGGAIVEGSALATRVTNPGPEVTSRLSELVEALAEVAERLEVEARGG